MAGEPRSASVKTKSVVPLIATWLNCAVHNRRCSENDCSLRTVLPHAIVWAERFVSVHSVEAVVPLKLLPARVSFTHTDVFSLIAANPWNQAPVLFRHWKCTPSPGVENT